MARTTKLPKGLWKRGGVYYSRFRQNGRLVQKRLSTDLDAAKRILTQLRARADCGDFGLTDNDYDWADLKAEFLRWAKQTVRNTGDYERDLGHFETYLKVKSVRQVDHSYVVGYRTWRLAQTVGSVAGKDWAKADGRRVGPRTVNREVGTLQNMLNKGVEWKRIGINPIAGLKPLRSDDPRKQRRALTVEEAEAIFREAPAYLRPVLRLFCSTGLRRGELLGLRFSDVDFDGRTITIRASQAKSGKAREIPLDDYSLRLLEEQRDAAKHREPIPGKTPADRFSRDHVFVTAWNTPMMNNPLRAFYAVCKRAGIKGGEQGGSVDLHSLRVTFTTLTIDGGANPRAVQAILGHSTLALTMGVYAKVTERSKRDAIGALPFATVTAPEHVIAFPKVASPNTSSESESQTLTRQAVAVAT
ncbi:MAG TPA: site-specific integrase [Pirellulaceae bacterium]|nr:site-specific integrase [Pirellulaceae bacterium]